MNTQLIAEIRFRCPSCQKLYFTDEPVSQPTEFECSSCQHNFFLYPAQNESGLFKTGNSEKAEETHAAVQMQACPKCNQLKNRDQDECPHCGILQSKFLELQKMENPRLFQLEKAWTKVLKDITQDQTHQNFLNMAQENMALNFASKKYSDLEKIMGPDPLIEKYLRQIELRLEGLVQNRFQKERQETHSPEKMKKNPLQALSELTSKDIFMIIFLVGAGLLIFNKIRPTFPNLTGIIVATTILSFGLWLISSNNSKSI